MRLQCPGQCQLVLPMISPAGWVWGLMLSQHLPGPLQLASELAPGNAGALWMPV